MDRMTANRFIIVGSSARYPFSTATGVWLLHADFLVSSNCSLSVHNDEKHSLDSFLLLLVSRQKLILWCQHCAVWFPCSCFFDGLRCFFPLTTPYISLSSCWIVALLAPAYRESSDGRKCLICDRVFYNNSSLRRHMERHETIRKRYNCQVQDISDRMLSIYTHSLTVSLKHSIDIFKVHFIWTTNHFLIVNVREMTLW